MPDFHKRALHIADDCSLRSASDLLHDAVFRSDWLSFDEGTKTFKAQLWREVPEVVDEHRVFLCLYRRALLRACTVLTLRCVDQAEIRIISNLSYYSLFELVHDPVKDELRFNTEGAIAVTLKLHRLDGDLVDTGEATWEQFGYSSLVLRLLKKANSTNEDR